MAGREQGKAGKAPLSVVSLLCGCGAGAGAWKEGAAISTRKGAGERADRYQQEASERFPVRIRLGIRRFAQDLGDGRPGIIVSYLLRCFGNDTRRHGAMGAGETSVSTHTAC